MAAWRKHSETPLQWWDNVNRRVIFAPEVSPRSFDLKHKVTADFLWLDGYTTPLRNKVQFEPLEDESPFNIVALLRACATAKDIGNGSKLHAYILEHEFLGRNTHIGSTLISMYAKCGALAKAQEVLKELPVRDVITWNALIAGYVQHEYGEKTLKCFHDMLQEGHSPNAVTFACVLKACGIIGAAAKGEEIHEKIVSLGMLDKNIVLGTSLVDMYAKCGALNKAQQVHEELSVHDVVSWNALIAGYAQQGQGKEALKCFHDMLHGGHSPNAVTFACALKACGSIGAFAKGEEIHEKIVSLGILEKNIVLGTTLVDMYAKCGAFVKAQQVHKELPVRDVISWNALIARYAQVGRGEEALKCFDDMLHEGHCPNAVTFACALKACGSIRAIVMGEEIHDKIISSGMLEKNSVLAMALVDMYVKCGELLRAQGVLEWLPMRDVFTWSALIAGYAEQGQGEKALKCFDDMLHEGHSPTVVTFISAMKACGCIGAAAKGEQIHEKIVGLGMLEKDVVLGTSLLDMYSKCGVLVMAQRVLERLPICSVVSWNALIAAYAQNGQSAEVINCFEGMQLIGLRPDSITLSSVLNACNHWGLLDQAETLFLGMNIKYGIHPNLEHYCCMTDLFSRARKFNKALSMIEEMPSDECLMSWVVLLGACHQWGEVKIGRSAFERALHLDKGNAAIYVLMADIYIRAAMQEEADKIEALRLVNTAWKKPGYFLVNVGCLLQNRSAIFRTGKSIDTCSIHVVGDAL